MAAPFDLIEEAKRLIRFNTVTTSSNAECAVYAGSLMRRIGCQIAYQESRSDSTLFMNVIGTLGHGKDPLLMTTHLDTVPPGNPKLWTRTGGDPWKLTVRGDALYGLGSADTKLDLLCKLLALAQVKPGKLKRPVILLGTFGEESGLRGAARFCQGEFQRPAMALVGEPSEMALVAGHKGLAVLEIAFKSRGLYRPSESGWCYELACKGQAAHSSTPALGKNAIDAAVEFLDGVQRRFGKVTVFSWEAGSGHNIIPDSSVVRFSLGDRPKAAFKAPAACSVKAQKLAPGWYPTLPWADAVWSIRTLAELLAPLQKVKEKAFDPPQLTWNTTLMRDTKEGWTITWDIRPLPGQKLDRLVKAFEAKLWDRLGHPGAEWQFHLERDNPGLDTRSDAAVVRHAAAALRAAKIPLKRRVKSGCSEAGLFSRVGIPSIVIGPGKSTGNIHRPNEAASLRQLKQAVRFYSAFLQKACS